MVENPINTHTPTQLPWFIAGSQVLGITVVVITGVWMGHYQGGYAWNGTALEFNIHPLCMIIGMVFLYGDSILVYRVFRNESKWTAKILHGALHLIAFIIALVGVVAVFDFHAKSKIPDMYSLHSWCGMLTFVLFCVQWVMGLAFFMFPTVTISIRAYYKPLHVFFGLTLFALAIGTALLGIEEKLLFSIKSNYSKFVPEGILANVLGLLLVAFGTLVGYILTREEWKRPPQPEEQALSMHFKTLTECDSPSSQ
ncbi:transmembrane ascorbate-dependent reductase CYB561 [Latimeria chalumnae]|uniref:Transmembrane ascorbate-dependent reductase CYB561 n=1 Tax=Latimeria chalumnae TaxID=7897 RepID=H3A7B1_LATCH|nr:PREDICTED: cytochrome b561 [Latimeria chalumnae]XP_014346466.1 PREDICTED: cytochrome b561 [Latimeria chalumnae]|eukprot:XP_006000379.1 PREDICTED: cytochrome b561 [Latimeria chalumnae]